MASLGGLTAAAALYVVDGEFPDKERLPEPIDRQAGALAAELGALAAALAASPPGRPGGPAGGGAGRVP